MNQTQKKIAEIIRGRQGRAIAYKLADYFEEEWRKEVIEKGYSIFKGIKRLTQEAHQELKKKRKQFLKACGVEE